MLKDLLDTGNCFKLVCGAGNEDAKEVEKLVTLYAKAGCRFFDLSADENILNTALNVFKKLNINDAYICISVGTNGDPHTNKASIDSEKCIGCFSCDQICPQGAIKYAKIKKYKCIGCGKCAKICPKQAISYINEDKPLDEVLPQLIRKGIDCIELHAMGADNEEVLKKWNYISENFDGLLSICTSRGNLSDEGFINRIKLLTQDRKPYSTIIQADGFPMSGGEDDYKTTLQAVATSEIIYNEKLPVYILISGGTNSKTAELAKMCNIKANGISIGSYARKIVKAYTDRDDFLTNEEIFNSALEIARNLIVHAKISL